MIFLGSLPEPLEPEKPIDMTPPQHIHSLSKPLICPGAGQCDIHNPINVGDLPHPHHLFHPPLAHLLANHHIQHSSRIHQINPLQLDPMSL